jgi:hypothetical protein
VFHRWSAVAIDNVGIPRITFNENRCFACCVRENMEHYKPHEKVTSDLEPFIIPGLSDRIELTTSQLSVFGRQSHGEDQQTEDAKHLNTIGFSGFGPQKPDPNRTGTGQFGPVPVRFRSLFF